MALAEPELYKGNAERAERTRVAAAVSWVENLLDVERESLPLFVPVAVGVGISIWQSAGDLAVVPLLSVCAGCILLASAAVRGSLIRRLLLIVPVLVMLGFANIAVQSRQFGTEPLERPFVGNIIGRVVSIEEVAARDLVRYRLRLAPGLQLPESVRVNVPAETASGRLAAGDLVKMKVRLVPPAGPSLPGSYDFARTAWFDDMGATGRALGPIEIISHADSEGDFWNSSRNAIARKIESALGTANGPTGAALLVGTRGNITDADAEALRNSGMAHLLSVSGLHVTAVVGGTFLLVAGLLALWPWFALRVPVPLVAAGLSAFVAVFYTLLTGSEVPTIRACIAALLILVAMAMGRDALSLRLLAAAACFVLLLWPEALAGPSFQLSFAAVATIVVLHNHPAMRRLTDKREEDHWPLRWGRAILALLLTGLAIELVLAPIALFHFHKSGLYGALANIVAIPLTTFIVMPAEMLALLADLFWPGAAVPFWWIAGQGIGLILRIAHGVSAAPGAIAMLPEMPVWAFGLAMMSMLVIALFVGRWRWVMVVPLILSLTAILLSPRPDLLLTGDGQHLAVVLGDGRLALLRPRAGDYARAILGETAAINDAAIAIDDVPDTKCNADGCSFAMVRGDRQWRILALRSSTYLPSLELSAACRRADIVVSNRWLPRSCQPSWLKADRGLLERTGGLAFYLSEQRIKSVASENAHHPWSVYAPWRIKLREAEREKQKAAQTIRPPLDTSSHADQ